MLCDDDELRQLNQQFRGQDRTTDVLSFCLQPGPGPSMHPGVLGDVVISVDQAARQAPGGDLEAELVRLMVHGLCHLRGLEHGDAASRAAMRQEETRLLAALPGGLKSPL